MNAPDEPPRLQLERGGPSPILLTGPTARARGSIARGLTTVEARGIAVLTDLVVSAGPAAEGRVTPMTLSRTLDAPTTIQERVMITPDAPAIVYEWHAEPGGSEPLTLSWRVPGAARWRFGPTHLVAFARGESVLRFALELDSRSGPGPEWSVDSSESGLGVHVRTPWPGGGTVRLVASATEPGPDARRRLRRALRHLNAQRVRATAGLQHRGDHELRLDDGGGMLSRGLDWAAARMPQLAEPAPIRTASASTRVARLIQGLGAVALGRFQEAEDTLAGTGPRGARLLARWRGDMASRQADTVAETLIDLLAPDPGSGITPLRRATRSPEGDRTIATWTAAWRAFDEGLADDGHDHLAALIAQGFDGAPGAWPSPKEPWTDPTITALVPATLVFGMLGARADAFFGRLRLAPQLPSAARELTVANLRCGPCSIELHYNRNGSKHTFRVLQTGGPVPLNLVFEPTVPEAEIEAVEVDGHSADLDRFTVHRRSGARVHLPLDTERIITLIGPA